MKTKSYFITTALFFLFFFASKNINAQTCTASFIDSVYANGYITFTNTSIGVVAGTSYTWTFGNGTSSVGLNINYPSCTYTANGTYTVYLSIYTATACSSSTSAVITVTNATPPCSLTAGFSTGQGTNGIINFTNSSTGTVAGTTYSWNYGDGGTSTGLSPPHTYSANGSYTVVLVANNNYTSVCTNTSTMAVNVTSYCNLTAGFSYTQGLNGSVNFQSTSTGTAGNSTYSWNFGDGANGSGTSAPHVYNYNGTYTVNLTVINPTAVATCSNISAQVITITSDSCYLNAGFTHTVSAGGLVYFNNASTGTGINATYSWNFGDGFAGSGNAPMHTYSSAGAYIVTLLALNGGICADTIMQSVNVTGIACTANSGFSVAPTPTPQYWTVTPFFPWNVIAATWNWGDGSSSNALYSSHVYSAAATYSICLTVTVSCGGTSSTCISQYISRSVENAAIIHIDVVPPPKVVIGINAFEEETINYSIYPNPNDGEFRLRINGANSGNTSINIFNLLGETVYQKEETDTGEFSKNISLNDSPAGVYFIKINIGNKHLTGKLIINK
jgi:PKD repeat protein